MFYEDDFNCEFMNKSFNIILMLQILT